MLIRDRLMKAIIKMQAIIRGRLTRKRAKMCQLVCVIMKKRDDAAVIIQKHYKRYVTQHLFERVLDLERNYISLKWLPDDATITSQQNVEVIGNFTSPPWVKRVGLDFCPLRGIYVKYVNNIQEGTYLIKFIVNGEFKCDDHLLPTVTDESGNINNILEIGYDNDFDDRLSLQSSQRRAGGNNYHQ